MLCFKFQQNRPINEEFYFLEGKGGETPEGKGALIYIFFISFTIGKHMKILCFEFHRNPTINEELHFFEEGERRKTYKFPSQNESG